MVFMIEFMSPLLPKALKRLRKGKLVQVGAMWRQNQVDLARGLEANGLLTLGH